MEQPHLGCSEQSCYPVTHKPNLNKVLFSVGEAWSPPNLLDAFQNTLTEGYA